MTSNRCLFSSADACSSGEERPAVKNGNSHLSCAQRGVQEAAINRLPFGSSPVHELTVDGLEMKQKRRTLLS